MCEATSVAPVRGCVDMLSDVKQLAWPLIMIYVEVIFHY